MLTSEIKDRDSKVENSKQTKQQSKFKNVKVAKARNSKFHIMKYSRIHELSKIQK